MNILIDRGMGLILRGAARMQVGSPILVGRDGSSCSKMTCQLRD